MLAELEKTKLLKGLKGVDCNTGELLDPPQFYHSRIRRIKRDIQWVKAELREGLTVMPEQRELALGEYRRRLQKILRISLREKDLHHAIDVTEKLAVSFGIDTKQPVKIDVSGSVSVEVTEFEKAMAKMIVERIDNDNDIEDLFAGMKRGSYDTADN